MGLAKYLNQNGVTRVTEMDWWQETVYSCEKGSIEIISCPVQHWSGRHFFDINATLWCSFIARTTEHSFFHCGDTGYCGVFKEIGAKYGPFSLAALPIGSYEPRSYLSHQHIDPAEAAQVHIDLKSQHSLGVHWGTFMMSDEHYLDPPKDLETARVANNLPLDSVFTRNFGETFLIDGLHKDLSLIITID